MMLFGIASDFARAGGRTRTVDGRDHVDLSSPGPSFAVASGMVSVFAAARRPDGGPGRRTYLGTVAPGGLVPNMEEALRDRPWTLVAVPAGRATVVDSPGGAGVAEEERDAADAFARVMLPPDWRASADSSSLPMDLLIGRAGELVEQDSKAMASAASSRAEQPRRSSERVMRVIGSVFGPVEEVLSVDPSLPPLLRACRHVAVAAGVPLSAIPRRIPDDPLLTPPESFAFAARIGFRRVQLPDRWWHGDFGPLLGEMDGEPVALVPGRWGGYRAFVYEKGRAPAGVRVRAALAERIAPDASSFAAPLPPGVRDLRGLLSFTFAGSSHDLLLAGAVSLLGSLLNLAVPFATGLLVSRVIPSGEPRSLAFLGLALASTIVAVAATELVTRFLLLRVETRATLRGSSAIVLRTLQLPISFFRGVPVGDLSERLGVIEEVQRRVSGTMVLSVVSGVFALVYLGLMTAIDPLAALVSAVAFAGMFAVTVFVARRRSRFAADAAERSGRLSGFSLQLLEGIDRIRTNGAEESAALQWLQRYRPERRAMYHAAVAGSQLRLLSLAVPFAAAAFLWWRFAALPGGQEAQVAAFMSFNAAFGAAYSSIIGLGAALGDISEVMPALRRVEQILSERPEADFAAAPPGPLSGALSVQSVRFAYPGSPGEVLRGVSIDAAPGDFVAIVGASGSGKSTLMQLMLGLARPTAGKVLFDGRDLAKLDLSAVRRQIGVVGQNARVMPGTVLENIIGASLLTQDDAWAAAEASGLADDVRAMPMQMHTFINEHTLSGGQLQKLQIARALVAKPRILVFDEATSALDEVSQAHVSRSLSALAVTRIVVAHRLSTVREADMIHVLSGGELVQSGRFDELAAVDGPFRELVRRQLLDMPQASGDPA
jgi:NHLM bacteriocin system ABC transporter ATP-binding protein